MRGILVSKWLGNCTLSDKKCLKVAVNGWNWIKIGENLSTEPQKIIKSQKDFQFLMNWSLWLQNFDGAKWEKIYKKIMIQKKFDSKFRKKDALNRKIIVRYLWRKTNYLHFYARLNVSICTFDTSLKFKEPKSVSFEGMGIFWLNYLPLH